MTYRIEIIADAGPCPLTGAPLPRLSETITIDAADIATARRLAFPHMTILPRGQRLHTYDAETGQEILGRF